MFEHDRQQWQSQTSDPKDDDAFGRFFAVVIMLVFFLGFLQMVINVVTDWYNSVSLWLSETWAYVVSFWPF